MPTNLYYTQKVRGFQQKHVEYFREKAVYELKRTEQRCPKCGSKDVFPELTGERSIRGVPMGVCREIYLRHAVHRIYCHQCHERSMEHIPFLSHPKARLTKTFERTILELRRHMSIRAVSNYFHLRWHTVKDLEKRQLKKKFAKISASQVKMIGIDEIYVSRTAAQKFITVIRDLESGAVLYVGEGKGTAALDGALKMLKKSKIKAVAMDMSNAYSSWFQTHFPEVKIVFDHFHVVKSMNEKLDAVRRRVTARLDDTQRSQFKGLRFIFLQNHEDLCEDAKSILKNIRDQFRELFDAYMFKETLRSIYRTSQDSWHADMAFHRWCRLAEETKIPELRTMARTIRNNLEGIKTYWTFHHLTNASTEGFNNKIRWLIRQAYGFRDREYLKLKIFQLPEISCVKEV